MGKILQIRVSASTPDERAVEKAWPTLNKLVWQRGEFINAPRGVMDLAQAAFTAVSVGLIEKKYATALEQMAQEVESLRQGIEAALADRNPAEADRLSYRLEDALDKMETIAKEF